MCATLSHYLRYHPTVKFARFLYIKMLIVRLSDKLSSFLGRSIDDHSAGTQHTRHLEPFATLR